MRKIISIAGVLLMVTGCSTTLNTQRLSASKEPDWGVLYNLPMAAFDTEAKFMVKGCSMSSGGTPLLTYELISGTAVHRLEPDPLETYTLRYDLLNSPLKITSATVKLHPNKMIKSLVAEADDRSAQVIASVGTTVLNLAKAAALAGVSPTGLGDSPQPCAAFIDDRIVERQSILTKYLPELKAIEKDQKDDKASIAVLTKRLKAEEATLLKLQKDQVGEINLRPVKRQIQYTQLQIDLQTIEARKARSISLPARLAVLTDELTVTARDVGWSPRPGSEEKICHEFSVDQLEYWNKLSASSFAPPSAKPGDAKFAAEVCVKATLVKRKDKAATDLAGMPERGYEGVVYLLPATGYVSVRSKGSDTVAFDSPNSVSLPQFGAKGLVWLKNETFDNNSVNVVFNEDGSMNELTFKAIAARAERGAAAAADASKSLSDLMQLRADTLKAKSAAADAKQKKEQQDQIDAIDSQIALTAKKNELELSNASAGDPLAKEKALLQKQIEVETLRQQYQALLKKKEE